MSIVGLLLVLVFARGWAQDFQDKWITRPPVEYEFPHAIYIVITDTNQFCSGSLIHESWVLSAAACIYQVDQSLIKDVNTCLQVYAGVNNRLMLGSTGVQQRQSIKVRLQNEENKSTLYSPALIKVDRPFNLNLKLGVNLVSVSVTSFMGSNHQLCKAGSYGTLNWDDETDETKLKKLDLRSYECNCTQEMKTAFPESNVDKWICGQAKDVVGICRGDFGMGMICDGSLQAVSTGLVRFKKVGSCEIQHKMSTVCRQATNVGQFADICFYLEWIREFVPNVKPPKKPCRGLAWHPQASQCFVWVTALCLLSYFLFNR